MKKYKDISGDGGSRVVEQITEQLEQIAQRMSKIQRVIAVGSAKGGVGKSTVVTLLAHAFADRGCRVGILDADINGPTQVKLSGLEKALVVPSKDGFYPPENSSGVAVLSFVSFIEEDDPVEFESVAVSDSHTWRATREFAALRDLLAQAEWGERDVLLVDLPPGAERTVQFVEFLGQECCLVLVTHPSDVSRSIVRRGISALSNSSHQLLGLVENMDGYYCKECQAVRRLFPSSDRTPLDIPLIGSVPFEPEIADLCDRGVTAAGFAELATFDRYREMCGKILEIIAQKEKKNEVSMCAV